MTTTKIEWTDRRWNPITGCTPLSEGCAHCYAKRMAHRLAGRFGYPKEDPFRVTFHPDRLDLPLRWRKPSRVFVNSMGDLFHGGVPNKHIGKVLGIVASCKQHIFQVLTKRPLRMEHLLNQDIVGPVKGEATQTAYEISQETFARDFHLKWPLYNLWLGVTVENAKHTDRIDILREIPATVRFISFEPLLGDVGKLDLAGIHWVIVGGETGPGARVMNPDWARSIRDQCQSARVPFFFKKTGTALGNQEYLDNTWYREYPNDR